MNGQQPPPGAHKQWWNGTAWVAGDPGPGSQYAQFWNGTAWVDYTPSFTVAPGAGVPAPQQGNGKVHDDAPDDEWGESDQELEKSGGGMFAKLDNDGDKVNCVFLGGPKAKHSEYQGSPTLKFNINIWDMDHQCVKILGLKKKLYKQVRAFKDNLASFDRWVFTIVRQGAKGATDTTYTIMQQTQLDDAWMQFLKGQQLYKLEAPAKAGAGAPAPQQPARTGPPAPPNPAARPNVPAAPPPPSQDLGWQHQQAIKFAASEQACLEAWQKATSTTDPSLHNAFTVAYYARIAELKAPPPPAAVPPPAAAVPPPASVPPPAAVPPPASAPPPSGNIPPAAADPFLNPPAQQPPPQAQAKPGDWGTNSNDDIPF